MILTAVNIKLRYNFIINNNMEQQQKYDYAIIGGGVYGLSIAYHLAKTQSTVALFERFTIGHENGSSHGPSRITRSVYESEFYRDMNTLALQKYWPEMQKVLNSKIIYKNQFIWFEERKEQYEKFARVARSAQTNVKFMTPQQICQKFPSMPYIKCSNTPIVDFEAAMIAADDYVKRLGEYLKTLPNVAIFQNTQIKSILKNNLVSITTETQTINAGKVVVAAGRWVCDLFPQLKSIFLVAKQHLAYLSLQNPDLYQFGRIPSFVYASANLHYYTTPDRKGLGYKIGSHNLVKDLKDQTEIGNQIKQSHGRVAQHLFKQKLKGINKYDQCYYTVTKTGDFVIDWIDPSDQKILICSSCSGHGFKFSPLIGKVVSDLLVSNKSIEIFQKYRYTCQIPYHQGVNLN